MKKQAQLGIIVFVILVLSIIVGIIFALSFMNKEIGENVEVSKINYINLFIKSIDSSGEIIKTDYILTSNNTIIDQGELGDWLNLFIDSSLQYNLYCWNDDYYLYNFTKIISDEELKLNSSKAICNLSKIGSLNVESLGSIQSKFIELNISTNETIKGIKICESHTIGILKTNLLGIYCSYWNNISGFQEKEMFNGTKYYIPIYYPDNLRVCGDWALRCIKFENYRCYIDESEIPTRLKNKVDHCWDLKKDLKDSDLNIQFSLETFNTNYNDKIEFYILDSEYRLVDNNLIKLFEINNNNDYIDIGAKDKIVEVK